MHLSKLSSKNSPTYNSLDGEVIDLLACICPEEFSVLPADLLQQKKVDKQSVNHVLPSIILM